MRPRAREELRRKIPLLRADDEPSMVLIDGLDADFSRLTWEPVGDSLGGGLSCDMLSSLFSLGLSRRFEVFVGLVRY